MRITVTAFLPLLSFLLIGCERAEVDATDDIHVKIESSAIIGPNTYWLHGADHALLFVYLTTDSRLIVAQLEDETIDLIESTEIEWVEDVRGVFGVDGAVDDRWLYLLTGGFVWNLHRFSLGTLDRDSFETLLDNTEFDGRRLVYSPRLRLLKDDVVAILNERYVNDTGERRYRIHTYMEKDNGVESATFPFYSWNFDVGVFGDQLIVADLRKDGDASSGIWFSEIDMTKGGFREEAFPQLRFGETFGGEGNFWRLIDDFRYPMVIAWRHNYGIYRYKMDGGSDWVETPIVEGDEYLDVQDIYIKDEICFIAVRVFGGELGERRWKFKLIAIDLKGSRKWEWDLTDRFESFPDNIRIAKGNMDAVVLGYTNGSDSDYVRGLWVSYLSL